MNLSKFEANLVSIVRLYLRERGEGEKRKRKRKGGEVGGRGDLFLALLSY